MEEIGAVCAVCGLAVMAALAAPASAQVLPATPPTSAPAPNTLPAPIAATPVSGDAARARRAQVTFADGLLDVRADNSSLNQILHAISVSTGMKITGGVADTRVFGNYGPAAPSEVLATLLDGTGTNMLLREDAANTPVELVLTPRGGGPTPPSPNTQSYNDEDEYRGGPDPMYMRRPGPRSQRPMNGLGGRPGQAPQNAAGSVAGQAPQNGAAQTPAPSEPPTVPQPLNNPLGNPANTTPTASEAPTTNSVPVDSVPQPSTATPPPQGIVDSANPPPPGATTSPTPNGVSTPEQIYQQLLKLQQQQNAPGATTTPTPQAPTPTPQANAPQ